jgi:glycosyltransferase involved in cell wall biosynthesis
MGRQPPEKVALALQKASGLILPTRADTSPNVVKEARVVGLPVITSPQGGQTTYLKDGEDGFLVPCHAISELTSAIAQLSRNPEKVRAMGEAGKSRYREQLRAKVTAQAFSSLYRKIFSQLEGG